MAGKIYAEILEYSLKVTEGLINDEQGCLGARRGCVD